MPNLKHLHLGSFGWLELTGERLESLWNVRESHPEELTLSVVRIQPDSLLALPRYKSLKALSMFSGKTVQTFNKHELILSLLICFRDQNHSAPPVN